MALFCWANLNLNLYPQLKWMFAVPNGGYRDKRTAGKLKATGVKAGVPDIWLPVPMKWYSGLVIELKIRSKKRVGNPYAGASVEQQDWLLDLSDNRFRTEVCYGWEDARDRIIEYLKQ